jgi:hypothetical protein
MKQRSRKLEAVCAVVNEILSGDTLRLSSKKTLETFYNLCWHWGELAEHELERRKKTARRRPRHEDHG